MNGGLRNYIDAFFAPEYLLMHPAKRPQVDKVRTCPPQRPLYALFGETSS